MRIELAGGSVKRLVNLWRDSQLLPGEKPAERITVTDSNMFHSGRGAQQVAATPIVAAGRFSQFLVDDGEAGDRLLAVLAEGPVRPEVVAGDTVEVDLDRIGRPR